MDIRFIRTVSGIVIFLIILFTFILKIDFYFFILIILMIFFDLYKSRILKFSLSFEYFFIIPMLVIMFYLYPSFNSYLLICFFLSITLSLFVKLKFKNLLFLFMLINFLYFFLLSLNFDRNLIFLVIFISFINDSAAYLFGNLLQGPKILPSVSPKKTWSGTLISTFISTSILIFLDYKILFSIIISFMFFLGDIYFSHIKRSNQIKDFSNIIPGHGGFLDRLDSIVFPFILIFMYNYYSI